MWVLDVLVLSFYFGFGLRLTKQAHKHLRDPQKIHLSSPMFDPEEFTPLGNQFRRRAMRYWNWGLVAVISYFVITHWVHW